MKRAGFISSIYFCFGIIWILISDRILFNVWSNDVKTIQKIQTYKGFVFVIFTTVLLYFVMRKYLKKLISKQRELDSDRRMYQELFESISIPVFVIRISDLRFLQVNSATEKFYGYNKKEFNNLTLDNISYDHVDFLNDLKSEGSDLRELTTKNITKTGKVKDVQLFFSHFNYFGCKCLLASGIDISDQIDIETAITNAIINTTENERASIAKEIHDNLTQLLGIASSNLKNLSYLNHTVNEQEQYKYALKNVEEAINVCRSLAHGLMPQSLDEMGLTDSIKELIAEFSETYEIQILFNYDDNINIKDRTYVLNIYRIIQEAINNILKHANATIIKISLDKKGELLSLEINDNGSGFHYHDKWNFGDGIGLRIMRNRTVQLNGIFRINSESSGTKISLEVPI